MAPSQYTISLIDTQHGWGKWRCKRCQFTCIAVQIAKAGGMHNVLLRWAHDFGPVFKFFLGRHTIVVINGASWERLCREHARVNVA